METHPLTSSPPCSPFYNVLTPPLSPTLHDVPPANHTQPISWSSTPPHANPCDSASTPPDSFLLAYDDDCFPSSLRHSPSSPTPLSNSTSDDLCATNYSPRFPLGHLLNPAFAQTYLLEDELGSGGYGFVMTALHRHLKSEVAVKFVIKEKVPKQAWVNHDTLGKIPMEIMLLKIMDHDNIIECLDVFEDALFFYVVSASFYSC